MRYLPYYSGNLYERFDVPEIQGAPKTFWEWINSIDWDKLEPYIKAGADVLLNYLKKTFPEFYDQFGSYLETFIRSWLKDEPTEPTPPPPPPPTTDTGINMTTVLLFGVLLILLLRK